MKTKLSWKFLMPIGVILWVTGGNISDVMAGGFISLLGFIMLALGLVDLIRSRKSNKNIAPVISPTEKSKDCSSCKSSNKVDSKYCLNCGHQF